MDGVLADVTTHFIAYHANTTGVLKKREELVGKPEAEGVPGMHGYVNQPGFFRTVPIIPGSQEVLQVCNKHFDLYIVSSAMEFPNSLREKYDWLAEHFPFIHWKQIVLCGDKKAVKGDIMVDDHFKNLDHFDGKTFLFTQPHNQLSPTGRHQRVQSWKELWDQLQALDNPMR